MEPTVHHVTTDGPAATRRLGARLGRVALPGDVLALRGDLGAGKTCFVQGLAEGLGVPAGSRIASPSFNIVLEHPGRIPLYHIDLYRLDDPGEALEIGIESYLYGEGVCAVEWMDRFPDLTPREHLDIQITILSARRRRFTITGHGPRGAALAARWLDTHTAQNTAKNTAKNTDGDQR